MSIEFPFHLMLVSQTRSHCVIQNLPDTQMLENKWMEQEFNRDRLGKRVANKTIRIAEVSI
jgi:hypothetical protein